jgi:hypothetical protein
MKISSTLFMGGLGNMLFQASMLYAYSKKNGYQPLLNFSHRGTLHSTPQTYKDNIFKEFKYINDPSIEWSLYEQTKDPCKYSNTPLLNVDNLMFNGFFQSYKYFNDFEPEIKQLFTSYFKDLKHNYSHLNLGEYVSLHVRRGDYVNLSKYHHNLSIEYYKNSLDYFKGHKFLVFSDDIPWCKEIFKGKDFTFIEGNPDYIDLYLMSQCQHNIIANSTFSWWGAYLNTNPDKIIIHPNKWFGPFYGNLDISDLFPGSWVGLDETTPKTTINLMGNICSHLTKPNNRWSTVHDKISSNVRIVRNQSKFEGLSIFSDDTIESNLVNKVNCPTKIGWLMETREVSPQRYQNFEYYKDKYKFVLTHDQYLLEKYPKNTKFTPFGGCWVKNHNFNLYPKTKLISMVLSGKKQLPGHILRHKIFNKYYNIDYYGRGTKTPIKYKEESVKDYYFSIVIENSKTTNYFTEKILDCFAMGTIPIYWGCDNISNFFNPEGIIIINNIDDISNIFPLLTPEYYNSKIEAIKENLSLSKQYNVIEDWLYDNVFKDLKQ